MAIGTASALLLAGGAFSATSSIMAGQMQAKEIRKQAEYNAQVYGQQAEMIQQQKKLQDYQYRREAARVRGSIVSGTAGKGLMLSGSPLAILADNEAQMAYDKSISDYNLDVQRNYVLSGADYYRTTGRNQSRLAATKGYTNAFSTMLNTGVGIVGRL